MSLPSAPLVQKTVGWGLPCLLASAPPPPALPLERRAFPDHLGGAGREMDTDEGGSPGAAPPASSPSPQLGLSSACSFPPPPGHLQGSERARLPGRRPELQRRRRSGRCLWQQKSARVQERLSLTARVSEEEEGLPEEGAAGTHKRKLLLQGPTEERPVRPRSACRLGLLRAAEVTAGPLPWAPPSPGLSCGGQLRRWAIVFLPINGGVVWLCQPVPAAQLQGAPQPALPHLRPALDGVKGRPSEEGQPWRWHQQGEARSSWARGGGVLLTSRVGGGAGSLRRGEPGPRHPLPLWPAAPCGPGRFPYLGKG